MCNTHVKADLIAGREKAGQSAERLIEGIDKLDRRLVLWFAGRRRPPFDAGCTVACRAGAVGLPWLATAGVVAWTTSEPRRFLVKSAVAIWGAYATSTGLARLIGRRRPCERLSAPALVDCPSGASLPSDQAAAAFGGAVMLAAAAPRAAPALLGIAAANAIARVYAGIHYPSDVAAGALVGAGAAAAVVFYGPR